MDISTTLPAGTAFDPANPRPGRRQARLWAAAGAALATLVLVAGYVAFYQPYTAGSNLGYNLGLVGGVLMLLLLPYALRKRMRSLRQAGTMRSWFLFHIFAGLMGPLLVLFHSTFRIGSFNGGVALAATLLVTVSGTVGRYFYRRVYRGLSGCRATLEELRAALEQQLAALQPQLDGLPAVGEEIRRYLDLAKLSPAGRWRRAAHFLALGARRRLARRRIYAAIRRGHDAVGKDFESLLQTVDAALAAAQRSAQFSTYEWLFARWHVIHIPFLYILVLTSVVHVVAVHAY